MKGLELANYIRKHQITNLTELTESLNVSEATTRRRLNELSLAGYIKLNRGGSFELTSELEISTPDILKQKTVGMNKQLSSRIAASLVDDGDIIFIDNGTTVREMLKHLKGKNVKIFTNGIYHMINNHGLEIDINIIPGSLLINEASIVGAEAISYISGLHIDKAFIGANGFDENGVYTPHRREMLIKEFALRHASKGYIVLTDDKRDTLSKYKICDRNDYQIITESTI